MSELFKALSRDRMAEYLQKYPDDVLPDPEDVN